MKKLFVVILLVASFSLFTSFSKVYAYSDIDELKNEVNEIVKRTSRDYYYNFLATLEEGDIYQDLYKIIDDFCMKVINDYENDYSELEVLNVPQELMERIKNKNLTSFLELANAYKRDHPIMYFLTDYSILLFDFGDGPSNIRMGINYPKASERYEINKKLCNKIKEYASFVEGAKTEYTKARIFNELICDEMYYLYDKNGKPSSEKYAHNCLGLFVYGKGVCETYAYAFSILMNYTGGECYYVNGYASKEGHAWNIAKMDNGEWYYFDLTWNDTGKDSASLTYFCVPTIDRNYRNDIYNIYYSSNSFPQMAKSNLDITQYYYYEYEGVKYYINKDKLLPVEKENANISLPKTITIWNEKYTVKCTHEASVDCYTCPMCNETIPLDEVNHIIVFDKKINPTCSQTGLTEGYHCEKCGEILEAQEIIPATGHIGEWVVGKKASYFVDGYRYFNCDVCKEYIEEVLPKTGTLAVIIVPVSLLSITGIVFVLLKIRKKKMLEDNNNA